MLGNTFVFILQLGVQIGVSIGGCSMLKKIVNGPMYVAL
jgi:hypothetical protein